MNPMKSNELTLLTKQKYFFHKNNFSFFLIELLMVKMNILISE